MRKLVVMMTIAGVVGGVVLARADFVADVEEFSLAAASIGVDHPDSQGSALLTEAAEATEAALNIASDEPRCRFEEKVWIHVDQTASTRIPPGADDDDLYLNTPEIPAREYVQARAMCESNYVLTAQDYTLDYLVVLERSYKGNINCDGYVRDVVNGNICWHQEISAACPGVSSTLGVATSECVNLFEHEVTGNMRICWVETSPHNYWTATVKKRFDHGGKWDCEMVVKMSLPQKPVPDINP